MTNWLRVVAAAIVANDRVIAARRAPHQRLAGYWEFPGGKVEQGEHDEAALEREIREELGIDVRVGRWLGTSFTWQGAQGIELALFACTFPGLLDHVGGLRSTDHDDLVWCSRAELLVLDWAAADVPLISRVRDLI